jgi:DNA-binding HxlR family transcriptional regulator
MSVNPDRHEQCPMREHCLQGDKCPMVLVQKLVWGKWKLLILWYLNYNVMRFGELRKILSHVTEKMLTQHLRELEESKLIYRTVYPVVPPKVEYGLTEMGKKLIPILELMHKFGADYLEEENKIANAPVK